jgi:hypothetical protein
MQGVPKPRDTANQELVAKQKYIVQARPDWNEDLYGKILPKTLTFKEYEYLPGWNIYTPIFEDEYGVPTGKASGTYIYTLFSQTGGRRKKKTRRNKKQKRTRRRNNRR